MTLTLNNDCNAVTIESTLLDSFIASPATYTELVFKAKQNDGTTVTKTYTSASPINSTTDISTVAGVETINPSVFGATTFAQGIYSFDIILKADGALVTEEGCLFVDCATTGNCTGSLLKQIYELEQTDADFVIKAIQYEMLTKVSECQCKCNKALEIYLDLISSLEDCPTC